MKQYAWGILLLVVASCDMLEPQVVQTPDQALKLQADTLYDSKQFAKAELIYGQILADYPWSGDRNINAYHYGRCRYEIAKEAHDSLGLMEAVQRFGQVNSASIYKMYALKYSGLAYHMTGQYKSAIASYTQCKKSFPGGDTLELNMYIYLAQKETQP